MTIQKLAPIVAVASVTEAAADWAQLLGCAPTLVDGNRWAQFDTAAGRIVLALAEEADGAGLMLKVTDLDAVHARLANGGIAVGAIAPGHHERRFIAAVGDFRAVFYTPA